MSDRDDTEMSQIVTEPAPKMMTDGSDTGSPHRGGS
jgi:hypothetical protein